MIIWLRMVAVRLASYHQIVHRNNQTNTRRSAIAGLVLGQRRRRWTSIKPALADCFLRTQALCAATRAWPHYTI